MSSYVYMIDETSIYDRMCTHICSILAKSNTMLFCGVFLVDQNLMHCYGSLS